MLPKVLWNALLATPALVGAAVVVSASAHAAEVKSAAGADALARGLSAATKEQAVSVGVGQAATSVASDDLLSAPAASVSSSSAIGSPTAVDSLSSSITPTAPATGARTAAAPAAPVRVAQAASTTASAAPASAGGSGEASLDQIMRYSNEGSADSQSQVTSITQLSDVRPTDWAYQALQSLVERYGCIVGYPDRTYKGSRALTRYEFAAGLNACLDRISELIASSTADLATKEDLATIQRLQEEFAAELATLRGRVDSLEARTSELEANQFSTTTKLKGETIFAAAVPITEGSNFSDQAIGGYRLRLNFDTSFTGSDLLRARLQANNFQDFDGFGGSVGATQWAFDSGTAGNGNNNVTLNKLYYTFPVGSRIQINVGATGFSDSDFVVSTVSPFDDAAFGSISRFGTPPQYDFIPGGVGAGAIIQLTDNLSVDFGYAASSSDGPNPRPGNGLFNGDYGAIAQLTFLSDFVDLALTYANGYSSGGFFSGLNVDGRPEVANTYGGQVNFKFGKLEIGGGIAYIPIRSLGRGDYDVWSYQGTLALRDFGGEGNLLGILGGVTPYASGIPGSVLEGGNTNQKNNVLVEGFYRFKVNDNISITPSVIWLSAPGNNTDNDSTVIGALRTTFSF